MKIGNCHMTLEKNIPLLWNPKIVCKTEPTEIVDSWNAEISIKIAFKSSEASQWYNAMINEVKTTLKKIYTEHILLKL